MQQADVRVEEVYTTPFQTHNPMEPHATIAVFNGPDHLTLYDATQGIFDDRARVAALLGLKPENVRVVLAIPWAAGLAARGRHGPTWFCARWRRGG